MGKKSLDRLMESDSEADDSDLDAEMQAVRDIRREKSGASSESSDGSVVKSSAYNKEALTMSVEDMGTLALPFEESYLVSNISLSDVTPLDSKAVELDDLQREVAFYDHSVRAVMAGRQQLDEAGIPHRRPLDFFCEHFKTDQHMARIKDRLLLEQKKIEGFEMRKQRENNKKYNKQVAAEQKQKRSKSDGSSSSSEGKRKRSTDDDDSRGERKEKSAKRLKLDKKYRIGGSKADKLNTKKSINDFSDYNPRGGKFNRRDTHFKGGRGGAGRGGAGRGGAGAKRPGKAARDAKRAKR